MNRLHPLVGHERVRAALARAAHAGSLPAAILLHGPPGVGKQRLGLWLGQLLLCPTPGPDGPCDRCGPCRMAKGLEHPDLHWYFPLPRPKGAGSAERMVEAFEVARAEALVQKRSQPLHFTHDTEPKGLYLGVVQSIRREAMRRPSMGPRKVFLIGDAEKLVPQESSPEAANALLKVLEEPPDGTFFVLTSSEPHQLLPTIRSRTHHVHVAALPPAEVVAFLTEQRSVDPEQATLAAALSGGSLGRALGYLPEGADPGALDQVRLDALAILMAALDPSPGAAYRIALSFGPSRARGLAELLDALAGWVRDVGAVAADAADGVRNTDHRALLEKAVARRSVSASAASRALEPVLEARMLAAGNVNPQLLIFRLVCDLRDRLSVPHLSGPHLSGRSVSGPGLSGSLPATGAHP